MRVWFPRACSHLNPNHTESENRILFKHTERSIESLIWFMAFPQTNAFPLYSPLFLILFILQKRARAARKFDISVQVSRLIQCWHAVLKKKKPAGVSRCIPQRGGAIIYLCTCSSYEFFSSQWARTFVFLLQASLFKGSWLVLYANLFWIKFPPAGWG